MVVIDELKIMLIKSHLSNHLGPSILVVANQHNLPWVMLQGLNAEIEAIERLYNYGTFKIFSKEE
jgi:hypothetical protein